MADKLFAGVYFDGSVCNLSFADTEGSPIGQKQEYPSDPEGRHAVASYISEKFLDTGLNENRVVLVTDDDNSLEDHQLYLAMLKEGLKVLPVARQRLSLHADRLGIRSENIAGLASRAAATGFDADVLLMELTNICTLRCLYCTEDLMTRRKGKMPLSTAKQIINEYAECGIGGLAFHVMGEPSVHPDLAEIIGQAARSHIRTTLLTNATLIDYKKAKELFASGLSHICLSVQSVTEKHHFTFKRPHEQYTYEKLMSNIKGIILAKWEQKSSALIEFHIMDNSLYMPRGVKIVTNDTEAKDALNLWVGVLRKLARESGRDDMLSHINRTEKTELTRTTWPLDWFHFTPDIVLSFKMAGHWQQDFLERDQAVIPVKTGRCQFIASDRQLPILWNGDAVLCCFDYDGRTRFANLNDTSLQDADKKARILRDKLSRWGDIPLPICRRCLGIRIQRLGGTAPSVSSNGEVPLSRVAVFGKETPSINLVDILLNGGIEVPCLLDERIPGTSSEIIVERRPLYHYETFPDKGVEAVLFPPEWKQDANIIKKLLSRYPHLLLGHVDMVALNPFDRPRITAHR